MYILAENLDIGNLFWLIFVIIVIISQLASAKKRKQKLPETQKSSAETPSSDGADDLFSGILYPVEVETQPQYVLGTKNVDVKQSPQIQQQKPVSVPVVEFSRAVSTLNNIPPLPKISGKKQTTVESTVIVPTAKLSGSKLVLDLSDVDSLRNAIIAREILSPPLAVRDTHSTPPYSPWS